MGCTDSSSNSYTLSSIGGSYTEVYSFCNDTNMCNTGKAMDNLTLTCNFREYARITCSGMCVVSNFF